MPCLEGDPIANSFSLDYSCMKIQVYRPVLNLHNYENSYIRFWQVVSPAYLPHIL